MTGCYARACQLAKPCPALEICEKVWHLCDLPPEGACRNYVCDVCHATWTFSDVPLGWRRNPLPWWLKKGADVAQSQHARSA